MGFKLCIYKKIYEEINLLGVLNMLWVSQLLYELVPNMWATYAIFIYWAC